MVETPTHRPARLACSFAVLLFLLGGPQAGALGLGDPANNGGPDKYDQKTLPYHLDMSRPRVAQPIKLTPSEKGGAPKFVQVEIASLENPKKHALTFEVSYELGEKKIHLGSFSLYPADNPGRFLVATQGKLGSEGAIVLTLTVPKGIDPSDTINVTVRKIALTGGG